MSLSWGRRYSTHHQEVRSRWASTDNPMNSNTNEPRQRHGELRHEPPPLRGKFRNFRIEITDPQYRAAAPTQ